MTELRIGEASAELRATLRPIEWMVLEELALAAAVDADGFLVASTSARAVAESASGSPPVPRPGLWRRCAPWDW